MKIQLIKKINRAEEIADLINQTRSKGDYMFSDGKSTKDSVVKLIQNKNFRLYIISDEQPIGFCLVLVRTTPEIKHVAKIQAMAIVSQKRGLGYGKKLFSFVLNELKQKEIIYLDVIAQNKKAIRLYKLFGFRKTGNINGFSYFAKQKCDLSTYTLYNKITRQ